MPAGASIKPALDTIRGLWAGARPCLVFSIHKINAACKAAQA
jgi:hypothetical protein